VIRKLVLLVAVAGGLLTVRRLRRKDDELWHDATSASDLR
jgi:hypothetical protein